MQSKWVSHRRQLRASEIFEALRKVEEQRKREPSPICTGIFTRIYGLPCLHVLNLRQGAPLLLEDFHSHWHLIRNRTPIHLLEPQRLEPRTQTQRTLPESSTKRDPSQFEVVEITRAAPTCSKCHTIGHRRGAKVCPQRYMEE